MKRSLKINFKDGTSKELIISKATSVKTSKSMFNLDQLKDGTWRMIWDESTIPDFSQVEGFSIVREDV